MLLYTTESISKMLEDLSAMIEDLDDRAESCLEESRTQPPAIRHSFRCEADQYDMAKVYIQDARAAINEILVAQHMSNWDN